MNSRLRKITTIAMLAALAYVAVLLIRVPVVLFLKYEFKDVVITLGGLIWGPATALIVSVTVSFLEMVTISDTGLWGFLMNVISTCSFALTVSLIYKKHRSLNGAVGGLLAGVVVMISAMMLWNYLITPIYMSVDRSVVAGLLLPAFLPFNALKGVLNAAFTFLLYKPVVTALRGAGFVEGGKAEGKRNWLVWAAAAVAVLVCIAIILHYRGII